MDLYEYQARQLLEEQDIPTPDAIFAQNSHEVAEAADKIGYPCVIKAQVKIGHRGQAGGVKIAHNRDEAILESESILPMTIHGHKVSGVLVAEAKNILHEYYVSISVDRTSRDFDVLATANGGTEVEEIAKEHPEAVKRLHIDALGDFDLAAATEMAQSIGFYHADVDQAAQILLKMWRCFKDNDATLVEPGTNIKPANFLDIGGGASAAVMAESLEIVLSDPQVESVFINVYGGITSCVEVANGILEAVAKLGGSKPIVVRFDGNAAAEGLHILASANNPNIHVSETMEGAAAKAAQLAGEATQSKEVR